MPQAAILGTGLIGASIGMGLRHSGWVISGWDPLEASLGLAVDRGAVDRACMSAAEAVDGSDVAFLAGPLTANLGQLSTLETAALVTDVTSVKRALVDAAPERLRFVGGHPMAGREHAGPGHASPGLFRGAAWILCSDGASTGDLEMMSSVAVQLGANPVIMTAELHDRVVAEISHVPHLLAVALTRIAARDPGTAGLVSGSFRDLTRVAASDTGWWPEVLAANRDQVASAVSSLEHVLHTLTEEIESGNLASVAETLDLAREERGRMAPQLTRVRVVLEDRPGEIARVGHALETSHVDVRDLQLRHAEHGGGGVLTIAVRPGEEQPLRAALQTEGFDTE